MYMLNMDVSLFSEFYLNRNLRVELIEAICYKKEHFRFSATELDSCYS